MVYKDISDIKNTTLSNTQQPELYKAAVVDRVFSFLIDYLIFSPVVSFFLLTLFQAEVKMWKGSANEPETMPIILFLSVSFVLLFSLLQSFFAYFWQATPGQYFLKLKLDHNKNESVLFFRIFLRQISFWFSFLFIGLPWLAVLAHDKQQTFYDRISDLQVKSFKVNQHYFSFEIEKKYWQSLMATFAVFAFILFVGVLWQYHQKISSASYSLNAFRKDKQFCSELKSANLKERLETAIALNLVGQLSDECTDKEADFALWRTQDDELKSLAYYAKSLTEDDTVVEKKYLNQACQFQKTDYFGCKVATAFLKNDFNQFYKSLSHTDTTNFLTDVLRYELGITLNQDQHEKKNFNALKKYDEDDVVKKYLLSEVVKYQLEVLAERNQPKQRQPASINTRSDVEDLNYAEKILEEMQ